MLIKKDRRKNTGGRTDEGLREIDFAQPFPFVHLLADVVQAESISRLR